MKKFMLDIETTGLDPVNDDILQIAVLEMKWMVNGWVPGEYCSWFLASTKTPKDDFAREHMGALYEVCNRVAQMDVVHPLEHTASEVKAWIAERNDTGAKPELVGWNIAGFDIQFLKAKNMMTEKDFFYRLYDVQSVVHAVHSLCDASVHRREIEEFLLANDMFVNMPEGLKPHDAVHDCFRQLKLLNGCLAAMGQSVSFGYNNFVSQKAGMAIAASLKTE